MARAALRIAVSAQDQKELQGLLSGGVQQVRVVLRALALLQLAKGVSAPRISGSVLLTPQAIRKVGHRYQKGGLERALYERQRLGAAERLDANQKQRLMAMVCSSPPEGRARWTVRLVAAEAENASWRLAWEEKPSAFSCSATTSSRGGKCVVRDLDEDYIAKMEDVLETYEQPYDSQHPVLCLDETLVMLHADVGPTSPAQPGREAGRDNEYQRAERLMFFVP